MYVWARDKGAKAASADADGPAATKEGA